MIFLIAILATAVSITYLLVSPVKGILLTVLFKSVIDATWNTHFFGVNMLMVIGVIIPLLVLPRIFLKRDGQKLKMPLYVVGLLFFLSNSMIIRVYYKRIAHCC